jgi:hypothetical protein
MTYTVLTGNSAGYVNDATSSLNVVHHFSGRGKIQPQCTGGSATTTASFIKITAIKAGSLSNHGI